MAERRRDDGHFADQRFFTPIHGTSNLNDNTKSAASEMTKSGRMRKKSAKLIEMEEVDKLEKTPRKVEPSKSKKTKASKMSDRLFTAATSAVQAFESANLSEDSSDLAPLVIANVFSQAPIKTGPESRGSIGLGAAETTSAAKPKKSKAKKTSPVSASDRFLGAFSSVHQSNEVELLHHGNVGFGSGVVGMEQTTAPSSHRVGTTPKKPSKKKTSIVPPFTIKLENTGDHSIVNGGAQPEFMAGEMPLPISSAFSSNNPLLSQTNTELMLKDEFDGHVIGGGFSTIHKEKPKKKDKIGRHNADMLGSADEGQMLGGLLEPKRHAGKKLKIGKPLQNPRKDMEKPKKKRQKGYTAYMLWCSVQRSKVVSQNPGIDFAQISKRLGDMWQTVPEKEKMTWRRKARRMAKKGSSLIKTGLKDELSAIETGHHKMLYSNKPLKIKARPADDPVMKMTTIDHVDVAAHLKLLGESLTTIGARLQEHRGNIAVQGSLSVLLDSLLCTMGPLMCLTNQVPELNGCPEEVHRNTLENIAYIMPGVG